MKTYLGYPLIIVLVLIFSSNSFSQDPIETGEHETFLITYGAENDFVSRYIWNGLNYNHGIIHQPTIWVALNDFTLFSWASLTQNDVDNQSVNNEIDLALLYCKKISLLNLESSLTYINALQEDAPATTEVYLKLSYPLFQAEIFTDVTLDFMEYSGSLSGNVGLLKNIFENEELCVSAGISLGWANTKFNSDYIGIIKNIKPINYSLLFTEATYYLSDNVYIKPHIEYCYLFSPVFKATSGNSLTNFGLAAGVSF
jgi:hypothetical protein